MMTVTTRKTKPRAVSLHVLALACFCFCFCSTRFQLSSAFVINIGSRNGQVPSAATSNYNHNHNHNFNYNYNSNYNFLHATKEDQMFFATNSNPDPADSNQNDITANSAAILSTLQKRLTNGDKSLTPSEVEHTLSITNTLLTQLDDLQSQNELTLYNAASSLDDTTVSTMKQAGYVMDERMTDAAFTAVVKSIDDAEAMDLPISANATNMLHHIFDADLVNLLQREQTRTNLTCMKPDEGGGTGAAAKKMNYIFDDGDHKNLPLEEGRRCEGGNCCDKCSRNIFPTFASDKESSLAAFPELASLTFNDLEKVSSATIVQFVRLVERVRRTMAYEYGLDLSTLLPLQAYSRKYVAGTTQQGGGGGEGDFVTLHTDEATHEGYHYSCVIYLSTHNVDFEGGAFVFNDPAKEEGDEDVDGDGNGVVSSSVSSSDNVRVDDEEEDYEVDEALLEAIRSGELPDEPVPTEESEYSCLEEEIRKAGREFTPFYPTKGSAVIFSSGWENMHEVEKITSGVRYAVPAFFTTCPVPEAAYDQMKVGKPKTEEDIADDWLHLLLAHRKEAPMESVGRVKELLMKWHYMCTPLSQH